MARKIRENHQNYNNSKEAVDNNYQSKDKSKGKQYIIARMVDTFGKKDNYHLNEVNIKYLPDALLLDKDNKGNHFRIRNVKHTKNRKDDVLSINILKDNDFNKDKLKVKLNYKPNIINNPEMTKYNNKNANITNNKNINDINNIISSNKNDNLIYTNINYHNNFQTNINNYFSICNFLTNMSFNEKENYLEQLWKKFGIKENYINVFNSIKNNINDLEDKSDFIISEIENLKKFEEILLKLSEEIENREKNINMIKNFFETMNIKEEITENKAIMNDFNNLIISYRESSIKVIEYYILYKEKIIRGNIKGKFDDDYIMKKFGLIKNDLNYLIKMKSDMSFLCNSKISNYIANKDIFSSIKGDPFLTCLYNLIPVSIDYKKKIKYCHYYIIQESFIDKINIKNNYNNNNSDIKENKNKIKTTHINIDTSNQSSKIESDFSKKYKNNINKYKNNYFEENKNDTEINNQDIIHKNKNENLLHNSLKGSFNINNDDNIVNIIDNNDNSINNNRENYTVSYYTGSFSKFVTLYDEYYKKIPIEQKKIFNIQENPMNYLKHNYYPKIIIYKDNNLNLIKGICIYSIVLSYYEDIPNQIIIEHLSTYNKEEMEIILKKIFEYLKSNNILNNSNTNNNNKIEVFIDLYFYLENEKFLIDTNIRDFIKNEFKFRWVKLENISKGIRFQKMKYQYNANTSPNNENEEKDNNNNFYNEDTIERNSTIDKNGNNLCFNFSIKNESIMKFMKQNEALNLNKDNSIPNDNKYINPFNIIYLIKKLFTIEDKKYSEYIFNNIDNYFIENDKEIKEILNKNEENSNDILDNNPYISSDFKQLVDLDFEQKNGSNYKFDIKAKMDILPLFDNCISIKYKNYFFNRIESNNAKLFIEKTTNQKFFFITSANNENINLLISTTLNKEFTDKYITSQDNSNISLKFKDIYDNMDIIETNQNDNKYLYIPSFKVNSKIKNYYKGENKNTKSEEINNKYIIGNYNENCKIQFISEDLLEKSKMNDEMNFYYDKIEEDYINNRESIIDDNFIIFVINYEVISKIATIPLISLYITKDKFISDK